MLATVLNWLTGGVVKQVTDPLLQAYQAKLNASNDHERLEIERDIENIRAAKEIALAEQHDRYSATRLGRWFVVVPFGLWWAAIYVVQFLNPWLFEPLFSTTLVVYDVPSRIHDMAMVLVPAIILGDVGALVARRTRR